MSRRLARSGGEQRGAVVLGGDFQGLGVMANLGEHGVPSFLVDSEINIGRFSSHCRGYSRGPAPSAEGGAALSAHLLDLADRFHLDEWVLFPCSDEAAHALSRFRATLSSRFVVPVCSWDVMAQFADKRATHELAERAGVAFPRTAYPADEAGLDGLDLDYPLIVKPRTRDPFFRISRRKAIRADNPSELREAWRYACGIVPAADLSVQEVIPGGTDGLFSLGAYVRDGEVVGRVVAHRRRQHPMDFGRATTFAETIDAPEVEELGARVLKEAGYEGLAEVEFMRNSDTGRLALLEVNPRIWGWHTLAIRAGVELPYLYYRGAIGQSTPPVDGYARGVKWMRPITDIPTALGEVLGGRLSVGEYAASIAGSAEFAPALRTDPLPALMEWLMIPYLWAKRGF